MLRGWLITIEAFVMLLDSIPWGYAADVYGRKPIITILMLGLCLTAAWIQVVCWLWRVIPIEVVWGAGAFAAFGGGSAITTAISLQGRQRCCSGAEESFDILPDCGRGYVNTGHRTFRLSGSYED
jgi:MFS family permease